MCVVSGTYNNYQVLIVYHVHNSRNCVHVYIAENTKTLSYCLLEAFFSLFFIGSPSLPLFQIT